MDIKCFRVLLIPLVVKDDAVVDSDIQNYVDLMRSMDEEARKKMNANIHYYMLLPRGMRRVSELESEFDNLTVITENRSKYRFWHDTVLVDPDVLMKFSLNYGDIPVDAIFTSRTEVAPYIERVVQDYRMTSDSAVRESGSSPPIIIYESRVLGRSDTHNPFSSVALQLRALAYARYKSIIASGHEIDQAIDASYMWLSKAMFRNLIDNIYRSGYKIDFKFMDEIRSRVRKDKDKRLLMWGGRFSGQKRIGFVLDVYERVYALRDDVEVVFTTMDDFVSANVRIDERLRRRLRDAPVNIEYGVDRRRYLEWLAKSDVFLSGSLHEGFSVGHAEAGYLTAVVVPERPWSMYMFGSDYELMYNQNSVLDAVSKVMWVLDNPDKVDSIIERVRKRIVNLVHGVTPFGLMVKEYEKVYNHVSNMLGGDVEKILNSALDVLRESGYREASLKKIVKVANDIANRNVDMGMGYRKFPGYWRVYQYLKNAVGLRDKCMEVPVFEL